MMLCMNLGKEHIYNDLEYAKIERKWISDFLAPRSNTEMISERGGEEIEHDY